MAEHFFHLDAVWNGGRLGNGHLTAGNLKTEISVPKELGGPGVGSNPEEMLIGAAATCYLITLAAVLENRKLQIADLSLQTEGAVDDDGGLHFTRIIHRPSIVLRSGSSDQDLATAKAAAERAEKACMITKAVSGNVSVTVEPLVKVEE